MEQVNDGQMRQHPGAGDTTARRRPPAKYVLMRVPVPETDWMDYLETYIRVLDKMVRQEDWTTVLSATHRSRQLRQRIIQYATPQQLRTFARFRYLACEAMSPS